MRELSILKMEHGGYVVQQRSSSHDYFREPSLVFSSTTIDEALRWIKNRLEAPEGRGNEPVADTK